MILDTICNRKLFGEVDQKLSDYLNDIESLKNDPGKI